MGQQPAKQFQAPRPIGASSPSGLVTQSQAAPLLPQNALQPLIQNQIPFTQTANNVPGAFKYNYLTDKIPDYGGLSIGPNDSIYDTHPLLGGNTSWMNRPKMNT